jgi:hypothetical protein
VHPRNAFYPAGVMPMARLIKFFAACLFSLCLVSLARAQTAQDMANACQTLIQGIKPDAENKTMIEMPSDNKANQCWGYFTAVQQYGMLVGNNNLRITATCPNNTTLTQIIQAFLAYAKANPKQLGEPAAVVSYNMMHQTFPCN